MLARDESKAPEKIDPKDKKQPVKKEEPKGKKGEKMDGVFSWGETKLKFDS